MCARAAPRRCRRRSPSPRRNLCSPNRETRS
jgi:hypothetical protein